MKNNIIHIVQIYTAKNERGEKTFVQICIQKEIEGIIYTYDTFIKQDEKILYSTLPKHIKNDFLCCAPESYIIANEISKFIKGCEIEENELFFKFLHKYKIKV